MCLSHEKVYAFLRSDLFKHTWHGRHPQPAETRPLAAPTYKQHNNVKTIEDSFEYVHVVYRQNILLQSVSEYTTAECE